VANYLVTGGCGFIGSHLVDALLARGDQVRVLDDLSTGRRENLDPAAELIVGDVADLALTHDAMDGMDGCFHLAAIASVQQSVEHWYATHRANQAGAIAVFDAARQAAHGRACPVVYASSAAVYGNNQAMPLVETATTEPLTAYGADKLGCEMHGRVAWLVHRVPTTGLRFFNVYGPRQDPASPYSGVIALFAGRIAASAALTIFGDGQQERDFIYVRDVVQHLLGAMARQPEQACVYNVCTGRGTSVLDLAATIGRVAGRMPQLGYGPARAGDIRRSIGNPAAAIAALGVAAQVTLDEGLRPTLAHVFNEAACPA
jgi:UDP-glucose 4-epimerase